MIHRFNEEWQNHLSVDMFTQDVSLGIMPIGGQSDRVPNFAVEIQANSENETRAIGMLQALGAVGTHTYWRGHEELLSDKVEMIARGLARDGRVICEITRDKENRAVGLFSGFTSRWLFHAFGWYLQIVPKTERNPGEKPYVSIPEKHIWDITMPRELGGYRGYRAMLRGLGKSQIPGPPFLTSDLLQQKLPAYFNPQHYARDTELFAAKLTALWGWHQRDYSSRHFTEHYWMYRCLTLKWAQACLREHIVEELNRLFQRLHIKTKIVMKGLPTPQKVLEVRQQMCEGKVSFSDASDACSVL